MKISLTIVGPSFTHRFVVVRTILEDVATTSKLERHECGNILLFSIDNKTSASISVASNFSSLSFGTVEKALGNPCVELESHRIRDSSALWFMVDPRQPRWHKNREQLTRLVAHLQYAGTSPKPTLFFINELLLEGSSTDISAIEAEVAQWVAMARPHIRLVAIQSGQPSNKTSIENALTTLFAVADSSGGSES